MQKLRYSILSVCLQDYRKKDTVTLTANFNIEQNAMQVLEYAEKHRLEALIKHLDYTQKVNGTDKKLYKELCQIIDRSN